MECGARLSSRSCLLSVAWCGSSTAWPSPAPSPHPAFLHEKELILRPLGARPKDLEDVAGLPVVVNKRLSTHLKHEMLEPQRPRLLHRSPGPGAAEPLRLGKVEHPMASVDAAKISGPQCRSSGG